MAEQSKTSSAKQAAAAGNTAVPEHGDHDRVQMLSLRADGTPDQHNPEFIGDKDATLAATTEQFRQQAVSAVDVRERGMTAGDVTLVGQEDGSVKAEPARSDPDPQTAELKKAHDQAADAASKAAEKAVEQLHQEQGGR